MSLVLTLVSSTLDGSTVGIISLTLVVSFTVRSLYLRLPRRLLSVRLSRDAPVLLRVFGGRSSGP